MIRLRLLGESAIDVDGTPVGPESQVLFAVLLVLALERGKRIARTALHRLLWPAADDESGRHNLRQVLYKLRQLGAPIDTTQSSVMLPAAAVTGELLELTSIGSAIGARLAAGRRVGELLPGYTPTFSPAFADWVEEQRALLQAQLRRSLLSTMADARAGGRWHEVEALAREVLRFDALNEEATMALAEATALAGAKAQALGIIDRYLDEIGGGPADLKLPATVLRRRIAERFPTHKYVNAADNCFVGRAREMAELLGVWHRAKDRRGGAVLVWGEPGIGKTRLAHELGKVAVLQGAQLQRVASRSWDVQRPLGAIVDLVPSLRDLPGAAGIDPPCNDYLDRLTRHDPDRPLTDLPDPATLHRHVRQAVFDLIDALLAEAPLVLVFEDVQWLDVASWEVIAELLRLARTRRLLLVLTSRALAPPQMPESEDWEALRRIRLDGIDAAATHELLDAITREAGRYVDPDYREWCVPLANGNPLHVQEIALQWLEKGSVLDVPSSVRAMTEERIARLSRSALLVLQLSAIMGGDSRLGWYSRTTLLTRREVLDAAAELAQARLVTPNAAPLSARHPVIEEVALKYLDTISRTELYRAAAAALELSGRDDADAQVLWRASLCWSKAGDDANALQAALRCANHLMHVGLPAEAADVLVLANGFASTDGERAALVSAKVLALAQSDDWSQVALTLEGYRPDQAHLTDAPTGPAVLRLLEARWRQHSMSTPIITDAIAIASSPLYDGSTRLASATLALALSDNRDGRLVEYESTKHHITRLLQDDSIRAVEKWRHEMIRHACLFEPMEAAWCARNMLQSFDYSSRPFDSSYHRQAALAIRYGGDAREAENVLLSAVEYSRRDRAVHSLAHCFNALATNALYFQDVEQAQRWFTFVGAAPNSAHHLLASYGVAYTRAQISAATEDMPALRSAAEALGDPLRSDDNARRRMATLATALRLCAMFDDMSTCSWRILLDRCMEELRHHQHRGFADFAVSACVRVLDRTSQSGRGDDLLLAYLTRHRLERCGLHLDLLPIVQQRVQEGRLSPHVITAKREPRSSDERPPGDRLAPLPVRESLASAGISNGGPEH